MAMELTTSQTGGLAELKITAEAAALGIDVYRPVIDGGRSDLIFDPGPRLLRVQCKSATHKDDVVAVRLQTSRYTPSRGYVRTTYSAGQIDGIAVCCRALDRCFFLPIAGFERRHTSTCGCSPRGTASWRVLRWPTITRLGL